MASCERLVDRGVVKHIGMSSVMIRKLEAVLPLCRIKPAAIEVELHPSFQQQELYDYISKHDIQPIGSPARPDRDKTPNDVVDIQMLELVEIAKEHGVHPAVIRTYY